MNRVIFLFLFSALISDSKLNILEDSDSIEKTKVKNPEAQREINRLKREFKEDKDLLQKEYEIRLKDLKEERKGKMKELRREYRKKLQKLRSKYPEIPNIELDSKPKPRVNPPEDKNSKDKSFRKRKKKDSYPPVEVKPARDKK